jgi:flagellar hook-associated protein 1 FlgK
MGISAALNTSLAGLQATQAGLSLVASNVANAQTPGYVRRTAQLVETSSGSIASSVRVAGINREIDQYLQTQFRVESAGGSYASLRADFYSRLQSVYGDPNSSSGLEATFSNFTNALQSLATSPDSTAARSGVLNSAQTLAQMLSATSSRIQSLRLDAESGLADTVRSANEAMQKIADINNQLGGREITTASDAALADQRDAAIDQLSQLMDIRTVKDDQNRITVFTSTGVQLVGITANTLTFNAQGSISADSLWNADPSKSGVGTLSLVTPSGSSTDLIATKAIKSGSIAAYLDMRDNVLVQAQDQLDNLAATMAQALSATTVSSTAAASGAQNGFDLDISGLQNGDRISLTYTDQPSGTQHSVTIVRVDDPSALPLPATATANPNDQVIGASFAGGVASVASQIGVALGGALQFSAASGKLRVLDDGAGNTVDVNSLSATQTATGLADGGPAFSLFTDGGAPFTGAITGSGSQTKGFASRITVNPALLNDPAKLVLYGAGVTDGDATRPTFMLDQLTSATYAFSAQTGIGGVNSPYVGNLSGYLRQVLDMQGAAAASASNLADGQQVVVNALQQRLNDASGVNIDQEMARLISLQTAYGANARVMTAVRDMIDSLMKM